MFRLNVTWGWDGEREDFGGHISGREGQGQRSGCGMSMLGAIGGEQDFSCTEKKLQRVETELTHMQ